eukprot:3138745-Alexandrium_andersonii.AAC.1
MSASLVGSEMCIRDSCCGVLGTGARAPSEVGAGVSGEVTCAGGASSTICLLYTSDAADDM